MGLTKEDKKKVNQIMLHHNFDEMMKVRRELDYLSKEGTIFFLGLFVFAGGFLFNLSASIIYDLIKGNFMLKAVMLVITVVFLLILIYLVKKHIVQPVKRQGEKLDKLRLEMHSTIDEAAELHSDS